MVNDYDVTCNEYEESICYDCATTYDAISRVCILTAHVKCGGDPNITITDVETFYQDIMDKKIQTTLKKTHSDLNEIITQTKTLVELLNIDKYVRFKYK